MNMDILEIQSLIPHRYPFLLIDRIVEIEPLKRIVAIKNVTMNEPFFQGHFPGAPVMPGVLIIEAMAQAGAVLLFKEVPDRENKLMYFAAIEEARFRKPVTPGDQLRLEIEVIKYRSGYGKLSGKAYVDGVVVCEAIVTSVTTDKPKTQ
jgi:3-hydroxyacyl-[acyl-carrier-protein] dehydratase